MATYNERAKEYATNARQEYLNSLSYLTDDLSNKNALDQQALSDKYNILYDQIARQQDDLNKRYTSDSQAAYLNKLMSDRALDETLSQLGVSSQGFGVNQRMLNENAYGENRAALQNQLSNALLGLTNQLNDARGQYNVESNALNSNYLEQLANAKLAQQQMADKYYTQEYNNFLADLQYQDQLAMQQQQLANAARQTSSVRSASTPKAVTTDPNTYNLIQQTIDYNIKNPTYNTSTGSSDLAKVKNLIGGKITDAYNNGLLTEADATKLFEQVDALQLKQKPSTKVEQTTGYNPINTYTNNMTTLANTIAKWFK